MTLDDFLGGSVRAWQPRRGFRAGIDSVLLAGSVPAEPGQRVLELGCGAGVVSLCLLSRIPGAAATGLEVQPGYAGLARRNALLNGAELEVVTGNVADPPETVTAAAVCHVCANPPYHRAGTAVPPTDRGRAASVIEQFPLSAWVELAVSVLPDGGWLTMILPAGRRDEFLAALPAAGSIQVKSVLPQTGRPANRILFRFRKGGGREIVQVPPLVLHESDGKSYTEETEAVLRNGDSVPFPP